MTTAVEMRAALLHLLKKEDQGTVSPEQMNIMLNNAQRDYVNSMIDLVDQNQRIRDDLRVLIPDYLVIANTGTTSPEGEVFALPYVANPQPGESRGYLRLLNVAFKLKSSDGTDAPCGDPSGWTSARPIPKDSRNVVNRNAFWEPSDDEPYYRLTGLQLRCWTGSTTYADQARIEYVRYPVDINVITGSIVDPELPSMVNQEVVHMAIRTYLETMHSDRYPSNLKERQLTP